MNFHFASFFFFFLLCRNFLFSAHKRRTFSMDYILYMRLYIYFPYSLNFICCKLFKKSIRGTLVKKEKPPSGWWSSAVVFEVFNFINESKREMTRISFSSPPFSYFSTAKMNLFFSGPFLWCISDYTTYRHVIWRLDCKSSSILNHWENECLSLSLSVAHARK